MSEDVLGDEHRGGRLPEDAGDFGPEVPGVFGATAQSGCAEWLARVTGSEDIHLATPRSAVEGAQVRPDRRVIQRRVLHPGHESGRSVCVALDPANSAVSGQQQMQSEFESPCSCAEGDAVTVSGMWSHIVSPCAASWALGRGSWPSHGCTPRIGGI